MDDKVVKIPLSIFKNRYNIDVPDNILQKAEALKKSCSCFDSFYDPKMIWEKKIYSKKDKPHHASHVAQHSHASHVSHHQQYQPHSQHTQHSHYHNAQHHQQYPQQHSHHQASAYAGNSASVKGRFHIIIPDFSDNSSTKRALIGHLNKLTAKNRDVIYEKIKAIIDANNTEELFLIIWSYIKVCDVSVVPPVVPSAVAVVPSDDNLYIKLLDYFDNAFLTQMINKLWDNYINQKEWIPPKYIFENNLLLLNNEYELYCDYVKWKKGIHNTNVIWAKYKQSEIPRLLDDIYEYLTNECFGRPHIHKYIIDIFLEQILKVLKSTQTDAYKTPIVDKIKSLDIKSFDSSTKFLIYNIIEK
jgi:hypothetical protein